MPVPHPNHEPDLANHPKLAALDLGSNSFHLVIARLVEGDLQILARYKERVRLAAGLDKHAHLSEPAIQKGLENLQRCNEHLRDIPKENVRVVATHTLRVATNRQQFLDRAQHRLTHPIEIISGHEEARLIFQAVAHTEHLQGNTLVVDIGGGSTELIIGNGFEAKQLTSRAMGCVSYTQQYFEQGMTPQAFEQAELAAHQALEPIARIYRTLGWKQAIATSGTAAALAAITLQTTGKEQITQASLQHIKQALIEAKTPQNIQLAGINENRLPVLAGGVAIMLAVMQSLAVESICYSEAALREGVLYEMDPSTRHQDIQLRTRRSLQARYQVDREQAARVKQAVYAIWQQVQTPWELPEALLSVLLHAAALHEVGLNINAYAVHKHSGYILSHVDMPGISQHQQALIATLTRFYRKKLPLETLEPIGDYQESTVLRLIRILRLAVIFNISRSPQAIETPTIKVKSEQMELTFSTGYLSTRQLLQADLAKEANYLMQCNLHLSYTAASG